MNLLDANGLPIDMDRIRNELARQADEPQSVHVAQIWREFENHPGRGLTPAKLRALLLAGERGDLTTQVDLADDMEECDPHLFAELDKRRGAVTRLEWSVEPPDNATDAETALAAEVEEWLGELDMETLVADLLDAMLKSFAAIEMVWELQEGVLLPQVTKRPARWFTVDGTRDRLLLRNPATPPDQANAGSTFVRPELLNAPAQSGEPLRPLAWLLHRHRAKSGYLARGGLLRVLAWPYLYKAYAWRDFAEFLEIYGLPLRIGKYPTGASDTEKMALLQAVTSLGHNAAGIVPMGMALEFQNAAQGQRDPFLAMLNYCDAAESKAILGQTLSASEGQHGTQALGDVHNEVRHDIRDADCRQVEKTITRGLIRPLVLLNKPGVDPKRLPCIKLDNGDAEDLGAYADNLPKLAKAGLRIPKSWVHDKLRIPQAEDGEEVLGSGEDPAAAGQQGQTGQPGRPGETGKPPKPGLSLVPPAAGKKAALAGQVEPSAPLDPIDQLVAEAAADWRPLLGPMVEPLLAELDRALQSGETLAAFRARLPELAAQIDAAPITQQLARAAFVARLAGEADLNP